MGKDKDSLDRVRRRIDSIDDQIHDLLMARADLVEQIASAKAPGVTPLRPGREQNILRRLLGRHHGPLPAAAIVRIWREIMGALVGLQQPFSIAVCQPARGDGFIDLTRNHFGVVWPLVTHPSPGHVVRLVADDQVSVGVVPIPHETDPDPWWLPLVAGAGDLPSVVARLPAHVGGPEVLEAFVMARRPHEETGDDRTLIAVETVPDISRDRLRGVLSAAGLGDVAVIGAHRADDHWIYLADIDGYAQGDDPRLAALVAAKDPVTFARVVGGYPRALSG